MVAEGLLMYLPPGGRARDRRLAVTGTRGRCWSSTPSLPWTVPVSR
ncbi:hypothetical protein HBB16_14940 [Pseudonocardia sp. MCCB 268]|nr:hypothetical protein [Pseudonocardia cytotoxica]